MMLKKSLLILLSLVLITSIYAVPNKVNNGRWNDDFNKGYFDWNRTGTGTNWINKTTMNNSTVVFPQPETNMFAKGDGLGEGIMTTFFDTRGYDEANISFKYKTTNLGAGDYFELRQRNKTQNWQTKFNTNANSGGWKLTSKVTANQSFLNSSNFMISFVCQGTTAGDKCWVDNVSISLKLHNPALIVTDKDSNMISNIQSVINNNPIVNKTGKVTKIILSDYTHNADTRTLKIQENANSFSIGLTNLSFDVATIFVNKASADGLFRCTNWDFANQVCNGNWTNIQYLKIGNDYNFSAYRTEGYAEINLTKAYHLDSSKTRIKEITSIVHDLDNVSRRINSSQYVEFGFNRNLTRKNAIKIAWSDKSSPNMILKVFDRFWNLLFTTTSNLSSIQKNLPLGTYEDSFYLSVNGSVSDWLDLDLIIDPNTLPVVQTVVARSSPSNSNQQALNNDNITVTFNATDSDGNRVINITDWRMNGTSAAILYFPFEADGFHNTSNYASTTIADLTPRNGAKWNGTYSPSGGSYECDATDDIINRSTVPEIDLPSGKPFSMSILINPKRVNNPDLFFNVGSDGTAQAAHFLFRGTGKLCFDNYGSNQVACTALSAISIGNWYSIVGTYDGSKQRLYVNGVLVATQVGTVTINLGSGQVNLCRWISQGGLQYTGFVDEVQFWNRTLTLAQIVALNYSHHHGTPLVIHNSSTKIGEVWNTGITPNDGIGDGTTKYSNNITIVSSLTIKPLVFDAYPRNGTKRNISTLINISANVTDDIAVSQVWVNITRVGQIIDRLQLKLSTANRYNTTYTIPATVGRYNITYYANDTNNNKNWTVTRWFNVTALSGDSVKPVIFDKYPRNATVYNITNKIVISVNVTDNTAVSQVWANLTRPSLGFLRVQLKLSTANRYNSSFTIPNITGFYNITFDANDTFNNHNASVRTQFRANDIFKPDVKGARPINATVYNITNKIVISVNVTDAVGVSNVRANISRPGGVTTYLTLKLSALNRYNSSFTIPNITGFYNITFLANDTSNNRNWSVKTQFKANDSVKPRVYNISVVTSINYQTAVIKWFTDETSNGSIKYGTTIALGSSFGSNSTNTTFHQIRFGGLQASRLYYYNITSCDLSGNCQVNGTLSFTTIPDPAYGAAGVGGAVSTGVVGNYTNLTISKTPTFSVLDPELSLYERALATYGVGKIGLGFLGILLLFGLTRKREVKNPKKVGKYKSFMGEENKEKKVGKYKSFMGEENKEKKVGKYKSYIDED